MSTLPTEDLNYYVSEAINCINKDEDEFSISGMDKIYRFEIAMQMLFESERINVDKLMIDLKISKNTLESKLQELLNNVKNEDDPESKFWDGFQDLKDRLGSGSERQYTIAFPLNILFTGIECPDSFNALDMHIENISKEEFENDFVRRAEGNSDYDEFIEQTPNSFNTEYSYWKVKSPARDVGFSVDLVENRLDLLLGQINYAIHYGVSQFLKYTASIWPKRWSELRFPFIYLVFENNRYNTTYRSEDVTPRKAVRISGKKANGFANIFPEIQGLEKSAKVDQRLIRALRSYQKGITSPTFKEAFLHFWRGLETLTLVGEQDRTETVLKRAQSIVPLQPPFISEERLNLIAEKRNSAVHEGIDVSIAKLDRNLLKLLLDELIRFYFEYRDKFEYADFKFALLHGVKSSSELSSFKDCKEREVELIERILNWKS